MSKPDHTGSMANLSKRVKQYASEFSEKWENNTLITLFGKAELKPRPSSLTCDLVITRRGEAETHKALPIKMAMIMAEDSLILPIDWSRLGEKVRWSRLAKQLAKQLAKAAESPCAWRNFGPQLNEALRQEGMYDQMSIHYASFGQAAVICDLQKGNKDATCSPIPCEESWLMFEEFLLSI